MQEQLWRNQATIDYVTYWYLIRQQLTMSLIGTLYRVGQQKKITSWSEVLQDRAVTVIVMRGGEKKHQTINSQNKRK